MMLETSLWQWNAYVTLSYDDKNLVRTASDLPTLVPRDVQLFLKKLRKAAGYPNIRFFACGEYGDKTNRPHYHLALFNFPTCSRLRTLRLPGSTRPSWFECCPTCRLVGRAWDRGDVDLGVLEAHSCQYVAGYVTKKMTGKHDERLQGRHPEFARMSLRPGIGYGVLQHIAATLVAHDIQLADVPAVLRHGQKLMPLGRYLRRKLRGLLGRDESCPEEVLAELQAEMSELRSRVEADLSHPTMRKYRKEAIKNAIVDMNMGLHWQSQYRQGLNKRTKL